MKEEQIKNALKAYNLKESEISKFFQLFNYAKEQGINYPYYYALSKILI
jgi:hypothetical protein